MAVTNSLKIFLVNDDPFSLGLYEQHLLNLNCRDIYSYTNGNSCLDNIVQQPDLIFLDHGMDILNALELLKKIMRLNPKIFVVFISGQDDSKAIIEALKYGAFDYIIKGNNEEKRMAQVLKKIQDFKAKEKKERMAL